MTVNGRFLVVVSILEGRHFPKRNQHQLLIETKFDGENLGTDPAQHSATPVFNTELAWELNKKALHQHRLQRTPIKLQCYAVNVAMKTRDMIGYIMLDLRTATQPANMPAKCPVPSKWYPLLSCKYQQMKPEIKVAISLELDNKQADSSLKALPQKDQEMSNFESMSKQAVLNEVEGIFQIGPVDSCHELFIMSVTIAFATNLAQLIPTTQEFHRGDGDVFFFYYSLLGHDVTNEPFKDLLSPNFASERASVKIRSSLEALNIYFKENLKLQVHLCHGNQSLGSCEISLASLVSHQMNQTPAVLEGAFQLHPPATTTASVGKAPTVGVSIMLRREEIPLQTGEAPSALNPEEKRSPHQIRQKDEREKGAAPPADNSPESMQMNTDISSIMDEDFEKEKQKKHKKQHKRKEDKSKPASRLTSSPQKKNADQSASEETLSKLDNGDVNHHYSFSIDLRSIKDVDTPGVANIYLRYSYLFFGSSSPIQTHPPVEVKRQTEVLLPHSFCAFDFATPTQQLNQTFLRVPLLIEVWHRDKTTKDVLIGVARIDLSNILNAEKARVVNSSSGDYVGWRQISSMKVNVESTNQQPRKVAELLVVLGLEDYGPIGTQQIVVPPTESHTISTESSVPVAKQPDPRETQEYKAAIELEMWKEEQAGAFEYQLKEKELTYMQTLAEEWKKRDKDRETIVKKKIEEYAQLENQLRSALMDIQKRENQLAANESEVARLKADMQREQQQQLLEIKEVSRRMKEDCVHQIQIEKSKVKLLEDEKQRLADQLVEAHKCLQQKDVEFREYKSQVTTKPEIMLQSEINLLTLEKVEFERKLESVTKSKIHYKQQWGRALKELARLKQKEQVEAKARLKRQQQELEHMRVRYLAAEEKEVVKSERLELEEIKEELKKLKQLDVDQHTTPSKPAEPGNISGYQELSHPQQNTMLEEHIARLTEERDTLLRTGVYTRQDRIISELDRQIQQAIAQGAT